MEKRELQAILEDMSLEEKVRLAVFSAKFVVGNAIFLFKNNTHSCFRFGKECNL